jgi:hypothetical protein
MPIYENVNGTWTVVKHVWQCVQSGIWQKVKAVYKNVGGTWVQVHGDYSFTAYALGLEETLAPISSSGLFVNGTQVYTANRSYNLLFFDKYGNVTFSREYDIFAEATGAAMVTPYGSAQFASDVAGMANGQLFALITFDEPQNGNTVNNIPAFTNAVFQLGATAAIFQGSNFAYRGAYLLLGAKGQAAAFEAYQGTESNTAGTSGTETGCSDGVVEVKFGIVNGAFANITRVL